MPAPRMYVVAGPPGSGKSTFFSRESFEGAGYFNADDRAAQITGSYRGIPTSARAEVNKEFEQYVHSHIAHRASFAMETTLRGDITFQQARMARKKGFRVHMRYVAVSEEESLKRVANRAEGGGHAASEGTLRGIHRSSMKNLALALSERAIGVREAASARSGTAAWQSALHCRQGTAVAGICPCWYTPRDWKTAGAIGSILC